MKVHELMTKDVASCSPRADAAALVQIFWDKNCGAVPVVGDDGKVLGMVTDRDLAIALGTRDRRPSEVRVEEVMSKNGLTTISPDKDLKEALRVMRDKQVGRLPVVDEQGALVGLLTLGHLARNAPRSAVSSDAVTSVLGTPRSRLNGDQPVGAS